MTRLEHIGIAVRDADAVADLYHRLLGVLPYKQETVAREGVATHFLTAGSAKLELLEALGPDSPVAKYLDKRGEGLHHLAFEVADLDATFDRLSEAGFTPLSDAPRPGADAKRIFFLHPKQTHGVLVEFCESVAQPLEATRIPFAGGHLAAYLRGSTVNPLLVMLHGAAGATSLETTPLVRHLEQHFRVAALDFAGHGASDALPEETFSLPFFADHVTALLDHLGAQKAHVFGYSMGGAAALYFAAHHPERVDRLALHGVNVWWDDDHVARMKSRLRPALIARHRPDVAQRLADTHGADRWQPLLERLVPFTEALPALRLDADALAAVPHPTLVSAGDRDDLFDLDDTLRLHAALPDSRLAVLPGLRHSLQALDVAAYARLLTRHLRDG